MSKEKSQEAVHQQMKTLFDKAAAARKEGKLKLAREFRAGARRLQRVKKAEVIKVFQMKRNEKKAEAGAEAAAAPAPAAG